jgi:Mg-chelatase subunit ChlD
MEAKAFDTGLAQELAEMMGGVCYTLEEIKGETLYNTVQKEMRTAAS